MSNFFKTFTLTDVNSASSNVTIHPSFDYEEIISSQRFTDTTEAGRVKQYKLEGGSFRFNLPLDFVTSADTFQIRDWWQNQTQISLSIIGSATTLVVCRITNKSDPFNQFAQVQTDRFDGSLNLISVDDLNTNRGIQPTSGIFILGTVKGVLGINKLG